MAWRLDRSIVRGEIDNRLRDRVLGKIWLLGRDDPVTLSLEGNCLRDIAGCLLTFENPSPQAVNPIDLNPIQQGAVGDITASRKVRILDVPVEKALAMKEAEEKVSEHIGNALYVEWFSDANGRVVIETADFLLKISEPEWRMSKQEELRQIRANRQTIRQWLDSLTAVADYDEDVFDTDEDEPFDPTQDEPMDEFAWEKQLKESDKLTDKFSDLLEKYMDHPDRDRIIAREMDWKWLEEALDAKGSAQDKGSVFADDRMSMDDVPPLEPDLLTEGIDWIRTEDGDISHPLAEKSFQTAMNMWHYCEERNLLREDGDEDLLRMIFEAQTLSAKLAGALNSLAYDSEKDGGFIVACLKRALKFFQGAISASNSVQKKGLLDDARLGEFRKDLFEIRQEMLNLMKHYRQKQW